MILYSYIMKITIENPTKAVIKQATSDEISNLKSRLSYKNTSVAFNIKKLKENRWLQSNHPHTYKTRLQELQKQLNGCVLKLDVSTGNHWFYPGAIPYISDFTFELENKVKYPESRLMPWRKPLPFTLYEYQDLSVNKLIEAKHGCVELCTGAGKTAIILTLARQLGLKTIVVTPSKSIFLEIHKKFKHHFGTSKVGNLGGGLKKKVGKQFTICVSRSLTLLKPGTEEYKQIADADVMIIDESHTFAAETLEKVCHGVAKNIPYRFFLSGTQVRGDGKAKLLESIIGKKVHTLSTKEAIEGGYICPVKFSVIETNTKDIKNYKDPLKLKRKHFLYNDNIAEVSAKIANTSWKYGQESTLILVEELKQIQMLVDKLEVPFEYVHSASKADAQKFGLETKKVDDAVEAFNKGEVKVLIGTSCIATGTNIYPCHNTIDWVGGGSEVRTKQGAVGRSVRVLEKSEYANLHKEKPFAKIYDFRLANTRFRTTRGGDKVPSLLEKQLLKRISMYKETNNEINYIKV